MAQDQAQADQPRNPEQEPAEAKRGGISRRGFFRGVMITAATLPAVVSGCSPEEETPVIQTERQAGLQPSPPPPLNPDVPLAPSTPPSASRLRTFTPHEARTVDALTARILPGTADDPGAHEAGVVTYIDNMLAYSEGYNESTYREPPYAQIYSGDGPPEDEEGDFETVWVAADQIERYGYQAIMSPREVYRLGVIAVDTYARSKHERPFIELSEAQQNRIIEEMVSGNAAVGFEQISGASFFAVLRRHTAEGMFSDPAYGGNRDMVGWRLIGYPGAQRAYTEHDIRTETEPRPPQALAELHPFSPGEHAGNHVVLPVSGSEEKYPVNHDHP